MASTTKDQAKIDHVKKSKSPVPWCDEFEKMVSGMPFLSGRSEVMLAHKANIRRLVTAFNDASVPVDATLKSLELQRIGFARQMLADVGEGTNIEIPFFVTFGCNTTVGKGTYINRQFSVYDTATVIIGSNVRIGPSVSIHTDSHGTDVLLRRQCHGYAHPVTISDDCWIGAGVNILPGVTIGKGCTIGAGAVVTKDIEPYSVAVGMPARVIKKVAAVDRDGDGEIDV